MRSSPPCATRSLARAGRLRRAGARRAFFASTSYGKKVVSSCCVGAPPLVLASLIATSLALAACMRMCLSASFCLTRLRSISLICLQEPTPEVLVPAINIVSITLVITTKGYRKPSVDHCRLHLA